MSFASFIFVAKKVDPPASGWLLKIRVLCFNFMVEKSAPSPTPRISWAYLRFI